MYDNRLIYSSLYGSDPAFFAKVSFSIESALQIHWCSCCNMSDRLLVNNKVLLMQDQQDMLLHHNFIQQLPKSISDKIIEPTEKNGLNHGGKPGGKCKPGVQKEFQKEIITDPNKSHLCWCIQDVQDGEDFSKIFYSNQRKCPKTKDGKTICMKLFLRGFCDKSCPWIHKLSADDEKAFDKFVIDCRTMNEGALKPDF
jgi:hypothetical protein